MENDISKNATCRKGNDEKIWLEVFSYVKSKMKKIIILLFTITLSSGYGHNPLMQFADKNITTVDNAEVEGYYC